MKLNHFRIAFVLTFMLVCLITVSPQTGFASNASIQWTDAEKAFIKDHPIIRLGVDPKFVPYEFIDKDGIYKGIAADYIKLISQKTGIKMEVATGLTWSQAYEKAVERNLDGLPCVAKTADREKYFLYTDPYYSFERVIVLKETTQGIDALEDIKGTTVAVQSNSSHHGFLKAYPEIKLSLYPTVEEALTSVISGKETAFVGNYATSMYLVKTNGYTNLKYVKLDEGGKQYLYFAIRKDWPVLVGIINKSLATVTEEEKIAINNKWIGVEQTQDFAKIMRIIGIIGAIIAGIILVSLYWIIKLRREIAERIKAEDALKIARDEAESANRFKSSFLARMSHEIRTPLNAITGMTYLIKKTEITDTQRTYLEKVIQASRNMLGIINDILDFSKIEAGKIEIERISFNLDKVLQQVITIVSFKVEEQGIEFGLEKDSNLPSNFWGDPTRIEQILLNVISNAVKFTEKGSVSVKIDSVDTNNEWSVLTFTVTDTGIGMTEEQLSHLFEPFGQADFTINRRFGGTGLGLSIVKNLVDMMGGEVLVSSVPDQGSVFTIRLPLEVDQVQEMKEKERSSSVYFGGIHTLVLDRHETSINILKSYLKSFNMEAAFFSTDGEATQALKQAKADGNPYDLVIIDQDTPIYGGVHYIDKIRSDDELLPAPKFILMASLMRSDVFDKIETNDIDLGITKPVIPSVLLNGIVELFRERILEAHEERHMSDAGSKFYLDHPCNVLVVEDNKTNQFIVKSILEQAGFTVLLADNGQEGIDRFMEQSQNLHIILMDLHMPVMNGYEAATHIRSVNDKIPIIAMTADAVTGVDVECLKVGINHFVSKPFEPEDFIRTLMTILKETQPDWFKGNPVKLVASTTAKEEIVLDFAEGMRRIGNNRDLYLMVLQEYSKESQEIFTELRQALDTNDFKEAAQFVHKIKGSSGNIGAQQLYYTSKLFQDALVSQDEDQIEKLRPQFEKAYGSLMVQIDEQILNGLLVHADTILNGEPKPHL